MNESAKKVKIKPLAPLESIGGDSSDIAKAMRPIMPPVSMATTIATTEETSHFVNEGGLPTAPVQTSMGNSEVTTGIPTGPIAPFVAPHFPQIPQVINEDSKYGKSFNIAKSTHSAFKVGTIEEFINLVETIKNNL